MFKLRSGMSPESLTMTAVRICACASILMLTACASRQTQKYSVPHYALAHHNARVAGYRKAVRPVEVEDDGIEAQAAPPHRLKHEPDDPSEPFSPNYGRAQPVSDSGDNDGGLSKAPNAYDPFLDDPQWKNEDFYSQRRAPRASLGATRLRSGFRKKQDTGTRQDSYTTSMR